MTDSRLTDLQQQYEDLQKQLIALSATLLRKVAAESEVHRPLGRADAERFICEAEECFKCARIPGLKQEIAEGLEFAGLELMAIAVDIETRLQRLNRKK